MIFFAVTRLFFPSSFRKSRKYKISENLKKNGPEMLIKKLKNFGEIFLNKFPNKKIVPILKRNQNRNFMWIIFYVMKFVKILRERTFAAKYKKLTTNHFKLISDNARFFETRFKSSRKMTKNGDFLRKKVFFFFIYLSFHKSFNIFDIFHYFSKNR